MKKTFVLLTMLFLGHFGFSQTDPVVQRIIEIGKTDNQTMEHLDILCNRIGGRTIGSSNYESAVQWATSKFEEWGMEVLLDSVGTLPVGFNRGQWSGRMLSDKGMQLHFVTPSYTVGTKGIQRGHVLLEPKTQREFDRMKGQLKGAWVLISGKSNGMAINHSDSENEKRAKIVAENAEIEKKNEELYWKNWSNRDGDWRKDIIPMKEEPGLFYKQMVDAGILGIIQSAPIPLQALYDRANIDSLSWERLPKVPDIKLDENQYKIIEQMAKDREYFQLEFDIRNSFRPGPITYYTPIGVIKGTEFPDQYVIMGGHIDSYDAGTGASDNGAGATPAMEAARMIMKAGGKPKRTILVCLWAGEEFGLLGSTAWVNNHSDKLSKLSGMFNRDGGPTLTSSLSVTEAMWDDFDAICKPLNDINPDFPFKLIKATPRPKPTTRGSTDSHPFMMADIPTFHFGSDDPYGTNFSYMEIWHTERDTYEKCTPAYMDHTSIVTAVVVYGVANLDHLLSRDNLFAPAETQKDKKKK